MTTIAVPTSSATIAGILLDQSALNFCTTFDYTDTGILVTAVRHPALFSSGESELWWALAFLAEHGRLPGTIDETHLDESNRQAVADARAVLLALRGVQ